VPGFVGQKESNDVSGPDGVVLVGGEAWVGDGDSTVKVVDLATNKIVATISTGGKARVDEMAYDPVDHVFAGVNNADDPPFITLISTGPDRKILAKIEYKDATDGAEQPFYLASTGMIYDSIPQIGPDKAKGAVAEIDPRQARWSACCRWRTATRPGWWAAPATTCCWAAGRATRRAGCRR